MSVVSRIRTWPRNAATGARVAVFLAGGSNDEPYGQDYMAGVVADPRFDASVSFGDDGWAARAVPQSGPIAWMPAEPERLDPLAAYYWRDANIEIERILDGVTTRRLTGTIAEATISEGRLVITCADLSNRLDKPFITATFAGTGGIEGGDFAIGRVKRRSFGRVWNVEGRILDKANNIYEFGDPAFPLQGCTALRDKGRVGPLDILAWQGSIAATFAALQASAPASGGGVFAPSIACAKWWTQPPGPLTADLQGEASGYSEVPARIAAQLLAAVGGPSISNLVAASVLRPGQSGLHIGDNSETTAIALDRLFQRITLIWELTPTGDIEVRPWTFSAPVEALNAIFVSRERTVRPFKTQRVGYRKNERIHGDGEISIAVQAGDVVFDDGSTVADLNALVGDLSEAVDAKRTIFTQQAAPTAAESEENDWWQRLDVNGAIIETYRRVAGSGRLSIGGNAITLGGSYIELCWVAVTDQRIVSALAQASSAANLADSKAVIFTMFSASDPLPVGTDIGDQLVRAYLNPVRVDFWNGTAWLTAATTGAPSGTVVGATPADTVEGGALAANNGLNGDGTVKGDKVTTSSIAAGSIFSTTTTSASGSSAAFSTVHELSYVTVGSIPSGATGIKISAYGQLRYLGGPTAGYPVLRLYRVPAANAAAYLASGSGPSRNPAAHGAVTGKNTTLFNATNIDMGNTIQHSSASPNAGDLYVLAADVATFPPAAGAWSYNWVGEVSIDIVKR